MFKVNKITWEQTITGLFYFADFEKVFAHLGNDLYDKKCAPSLISSENILDQSKN